MEQSVIFSTLIYRNILKLKVPEGKQVGINARPPYVPIVNELARMVKTGPRLGEGGGGWVTFTSSNCN